MNILKNCKEKESILNSEQKAGQLIEFIKDTFLVNYNTIFKEEQ